MRPATARAHVAVQQAEAPLDPPLLRFRFDQAETTATRQVRASQARSIKEAVIRWLDEQL